MQYQAKIPQAIPRREHLVHFYKTDDDLLDSVEGYLKAGEVRIAIMTPAHRSALEKRLEESGMNLREARAEGAYLPFDAEQTLKKLMAGDTPDPALFSQVIGSIIEDAGADGREVRAFGEMVAILWKNGNQKGAMQLEEFWNELQRKNTFSLFCAYPAQWFSDELLRPAFSNICRTHNTVRSTF